MASRALRRAQLVEARQQALELELREAGPQLTERGRAPRLLARHERDIVAQARELLDAHDLLCMSLEQLAGPSGSDLVEPREQRRVRSAEV